MNEEVIDNYTECVRASKAILKYLTLLGEDCMVSDIMTLVTIHFPNGIKNEVLKNKISRFMIDDNTLVLSLSEDSLNILIGIIFSL